MQEKDFQILRVEYDADRESIRKSFVKLSRRYHPEHFPDKFKQIKSAYDRLTLKWGAIQPYVQEISGLDSAEALASFIMEEAQPATSSSKSDKLPELDVFSLDPVLNTPCCRERITTLLEDIYSQGVEYSKPAKKE